MVSSNPPLPVVLVGLNDMRELFPGVAKTTVYRWNTDRPSIGRVLPEPLVRIANSPLWSQEQVEAFAATRGLQIDPGALSALRSAQGHRAVARA